MVGTIAQPPGVGESSCLAPGDRRFSTGRPPIGAGDIGTGQVCQDPTAVEGAGPAGPRYPLSRSEWLAALASTCNMVDMGILLAWGLSQDFIFELSPRAGPTRLPARKVRSGELFPLPVILPDFGEVGGNDASAGPPRELAVQCWVAVVSAATNVLFQCDRQGFGRKPGKVHERAGLDMRSKIERFLAGEETFVGCYKDIVEDLKMKRVSYTGEEISQPFPLSVSQIIQSLPPPGHGGSVPVTQFLKGYTKYLMENPMESLLEEKDRGFSPVTAKVHIQKGQEFAVFELLEQRGVITWVPESVAFRDKRGTFLSGLFGVVKVGKCT